MAENPDSLLIEMMDDSPTMLFGTEQYEKFCERAAGLVQTTEGLDVLMVDAKIITSQILKGNRPSKECYSWAALFANVSGGIGSYWKNGGGRDFEVKLDLLCEILTAEARWQECFEGPQIQQLGWMTSYTIILQELVGGACSVDCLETLLGFKTKTVNSSLKALVERGLVTWVEERDKISFTLTSKGREHVSQTL